MICFGKTLLGRWECANGLACAIAGIIARLGPGWSFGPVALRLRRLKCRRSICRCATRIKGPTLRALQARTPNTNNLKFSIAESGHSATQQSLAH